MFYDAQQEYHMHAVQPVQWITALNSQHKLIFQKGTEKWPHSQSQARTVQMSMNAQPRKKLIY